MNLQFTARDQDGNDKSTELYRFAEQIGLQATAPARFSFLLVLDLFGGTMSGRRNPAKVMREIRALEGIGPPSAMKPPIQNKHPPLKGLWHKHYFGEGVPAVAANVGKGLSRFGMPYADQKIREAKEAGEERFFTPEDLVAIANEVVYGHMDRLRAAQGLAGEWLLYAEHEGQKYYLAITTHDRAEHDEVRRHIDHMCCAEFPFLAELLANA
jgi:hypothetical protein